MGGNYPIRGGGGDGTPHPPRPDPTPLPILLERGIVCLFACKVVQWLIFFSDNGAWNEELIQKNFIPADAEFILQIQRPRGRQDDEIIWDLDNKGVFFVKTAYFLGLKITNLNAASTSEGMTSKSMWQSSRKPPLRLRSTARELSTKFSPINIILPKGCFLLYVVCVLQEACGKCKPL